MDPDSKFPEPRCCSSTSDADVETTISVSAAPTETARVVDSVAERALCRKFDFRILPVLAVMYLFNALDKGNLGNAKTDGFDKDLGFEGNQYNILLSVFYVPYVLAAPPIAMIGKRFGPSRVLPILMFTFGTMTLLSAVCTNWSGLLAVRWFLGMAEAAFFPLVIYYLTTFYRRHELARRLAVFYAASNIANAFSGLLSFGVFQIDSRLPGWRYLFLIEGACTVAFSFFAFWYLPMSGSKAAFLGEERKLAYWRMQMDSSSVVDEKFVFKDAVQVFKMPVAWIWLGIEICLGVPLQSVSLFLPQIVQRLGYDTIRANLYTVAPNVTGAVMLLILAFTSDLVRLRFPFIALGFCFPLVGFLVYSQISPLAAPRIAYFATFLMCWGTSAPSVLLSTWYNNNIAHEGRRVLLTSVGVPLANLMGIVSSNIFREQDKPDYIPALVTTACFGAVGAALVAGLGTWMVWDNKERDRRMGVKLEARDLPTMLLKEGPQVKEFRWIL